MLTPSPHDADELAHAIVKDPRPETPAQIRSATNAAPEIVAASTTPAGVELTPPAERSRAAGNITLRKRFKRAKRNIGRSLGSWIGPMLLRALASTWKVTLLGEENLEALPSESRGQIISIWHGRLLLPVSYHAHRNWSILVSRSEDGDITSNILERFGYRLIRGSSSRGGAQALREMRRTLSGGTVLVITPDGPRGPRHAVPPGIVWIARATGYAIHPCGAVCDRAWRMKSWDRFTIPKPFARVVFVYGAPLRIESGMTAPEMEAASAKVRALMIEAEERGLAHLGEVRDW